MDNKPQCGRKIDYGTPCLFGRIVAGETEHCNIVMGNDFYYRTPVVSGDHDYVVDGVNDDVDNHNDGECHDDNDEGNDRNDECDDNDHDGDDAAAADVGAAVYHDDDNDHND
ncbi:hypothetical protein DPMN_056767 [Dreissena polymorpha]|uniref:Uncharacterized protein n=1 Tax=Dreissena polymorpha TaxID=45954 RepID=A0A9D4CTW6_DREPO|nr:hypothetical protein DPMN_056767 [Dreissena polymorpha]